MTYTPPRLVTSNPTTVTVAGSRPYALPTHGNVISLVVDPPNRYLDDVRPSWYTVFGWRYSLMVVLSGSAFSEDFTTGGAYINYGHGGHEATSTWGFVYFDFTTGRWAPYTHGADANGLAAPQSMLDVDNATDIYRDPAITPQHDNAEMIAFQGVPTAWNQLPPCDHTYTLNHVPKRSQIGGGNLFGIRLVHTALGDTNLSASRTHKIMLEGPNAGRWSYYSANRGRQVWTAGTLTDSCSAMDEANNRIIYPINWKVDNRLYYVDLNDATWKYMTCTRATTATGNARGAFFDAQRNVLVTWTTAAEVFYVDMSQPTRAWQKATYTGTFPPGDLAYYDPVPAYGPSTFKQRMAKWPAAYGGDDCWYGLHGRGLFTPGGPSAGFDSNANTPLHQAIEQFLWKLTIPPVLTDPWSWTQVPIAGGILAAFDSNWENAQGVHFTRFFFVPWLGCFAWIARPDSPVQLMLPPAPSGGTVSWNTVPTVSFVQNSQPQSYDLTQHVVGYDAAEHDFALAAGYSLPAGVTLNSASGALQYNGSGAPGSTTARVEVNASASDWAARIAGPGVVWHHNFDTQAEVDRFRWGGSYGGGNDPQAQATNANTVLSWQSSGGADGGGYMRFFRPAGSGIYDSYVWWRQLSPLTGASNGRGVDDPAAGGTLPLQTFTPTNQGSQTSDWAQLPRPGYYGKPEYQAAGAYQNPTYPQYASTFDGSDFYLQVRVKVEPRRMTTGNLVNGKLLNFCTTWGTHPNQELVTVSAYPTPASPVGGPYQDNVHTMYEGAYTGYIQDGAVATGSLKNTTSPQWAYSGGWDTLLYHITPGTANPGTAPWTYDTRIEVWAANEGETAYTKIWDVNYRAIYDNTEEFGRYRKYAWNAFLCWIYHNNEPNATDIVQCYDQIIFSKQFINCPGA